VSLAYSEPDTVAEAAALLADDDEAKILAGGQSLMVMIRHGLVAPSRLVSLQRVDGLTEIAAEPEGSTWIGAMATYRQVAEAVRASLPGLAQACLEVGPLPVQNVGTPGGSICHNAPGADVPPALLALDAEVIVESTTGRRTIPLADFFAGYFETVLSPVEVLVGLRVPRTAPGTASGYVKFNYRLIDMAMIGVGVAVRVEDEVCRGVRIALGGTAAVPYRCPTAEGSLEGRPLTRERIAEAGHLAAEERELVSDLHCSADYRRRVIPVILRRALERAGAFG
jgi:carbon-monoxide dehydrogenase medium subunit